MYPAIQLLVAKTDILFILLQRIKYGDDISAYDRRLRWKLARVSAATSNNSVSDCC